MSMDMQRNILKRAKLLALVKGKVRNKRKTKPIILSAWTAATSAYFVTDVTTLLSMTPNLDRCRRLGNTFKV